MMADKLYAGLSFEDAVRKYAQTVQSTCLMRLQNQPDADDCFQLTFMKLYTKSPDFNDEEHLKAWLLRVAINECKKLIRDNKRHVSLELVGEIPLPPTDDENDISWAILRLDPPFREVLYLYYGEQYKSREIAKILGKNHNTIRTMIKRGKEKLRELYGGDDT